MYLKQNKMPSKNPSYKHGKKPCHNHSKLQSAIVMHINFSAKEISAKPSRKLTAMPSKKKSEKKILKDAKKKSAKPNTIQSNKHSTSCSKLSLKRLTRSHQQSHLRYYLHTSKDNKEIVTWRLQGRSMD